MQPNQRISPFSALFSLFLTRRASTHARKAACVHGCCCAIVFFNQVIITGCDWLVIHVKIMVIIFIYYSLQPFAVIGCVLRVTISRVGLYVDVYKITVLGLFFLGRLICEIGLYAGIYGA